MKDYTENAPVFSPKIRISETTDPGHADIINAAPKQLLQNTLCNQKAIEQLKTGVGIGSTGGYSTEEKYHAGEYCMYDGVMYRCLEDTEGEWDQGCWIQTSPVGEIAYLQKSLESLAGLFRKDEGGNPRQLGEAAYAGISKNFDTIEEGFVPDSQLLKLLKDRVDEQNSALGQIHFIKHNYDSSFKNDIKVLFADFTSKYAQNIIQNGGATFYVSIQGIVGYSGIALPAGSENHLVRYFAFNNDGLVRAINVDCRTNTVTSVFSIATNAV